MAFHSCRFCQAVIVLLVAVAVLIFGVGPAQAQAPGAITTIVGNGIEPCSPYGDGGLAINAELNNPVCVVVDAAGSLYICDSDIYRIRKVSAATGIITTVAGDGSLVYCCDGFPATSTGLSDPLGVAVDAAGNLYIADYGGDNYIHKVSAATGIITSVAGNGTYGYSGDGALVWRSCNRCDVSQRCR
jgi:DNA-binding beta-propeller fold protein YncE